MMENRTEFNDAYNAGRVHEGSVFFSPNEIGPLPDDKEHSIAYRDDSLTAFFCSEPRGIRAINYEKLTGIMRHDFDNARYRRLEESARELRETVRELVGPEMRRAEGNVAERVSARRGLRTTVAPVSPETENSIEDILIAREMVRVDLGVDLMIAQPKS
jgi:hypothetical protein